MRNNKLNDLDSKTWLKFQKSWFVHNPPPRKKGVLVHPAKFPETMAQEFIEFFTKEGETVLDPMAGTGSTLVAALRAKRNSYGIELNPKYAEIAKQIIADERVALGSSVENLKSEIIEGNAVKAVTFQLPTADYMLTCYDAQTEILTEDGWKLFSELQEGMKVATLEEGRFLRFREPLRIIKAPYNGPLYNIQTKAIDLAVTLDHNMYVRKRRSKSGFQLIPARQIIGKEVEYKLDAEWEGEEGITFRLPGIKIQGKDRNRIKDFPARDVPMDAWLEFLGYWLTEGSINLKKYSIDLTTADPELARRFIDVSKSIGEIPNYYRNERVIHVRINSPIISQYLAPLGHAEQKYIPREYYHLCKRQLEILYKAMMAGDSDKIAQRKFWTSSARLKDNFQELLLRIGYAGTCQVRKSQGCEHPGPQGQVIHTNYPSWTVGIWKARLTPRVSLGQTRRANPFTAVREQIITYQGVVYCVQVPGGVVYVRRNGKAVWCGNSPPYWDMLHAKGAETQKKRRGSSELDVFYSDDPEDLGNIHDYEKFLEQLISIYAGLKPLLRDKAYLTIIVKNVKKGGKIYPLAWDLGRELGKMYTLKDEKIWCLPPGQNIWTQSGLKPIEDVQISEKVLTHLGNHQSVTKTMHRHHKGQLIAIKPALLGKPILLTPEHEVLAIQRRKMIHKNGRVFRENFERSEKRGIAWIPAKELSIGDAVAFPIPETNIDLIELDVCSYMPEVAQWLHDEKWYYTRGRGKQGRGKLPLTIAISKDFMRLAGWYLSEGNSSVSGVYIANKSIKAQTEIAMLFRRIFDANTKADPKGVWCRSRSIATLLARVFGKGAKEKKIPDFMLHLPKEKQKHLIQSLWAGDGHAGENRILYKTVSENLALNIVYITARIGAVPYIQRNPKWFNLSYRGQSINRMRELLGTAPVKKNFIRDQNWVKEKYVWLPIREINISEYNGLVYNLEVETANTYTTENFIVHNCQDNQSIAPFGLGSAWVSNTFHHYCLQFRNEQ